MSSSQQQQSKPKRVAIIGAGASGLAAIKECGEQGLDVVCFEAEPHVGGLWRYVPAREASGDEVHSALYQSTVINNSKEMVMFSTFSSDIAYSDFPVPKDWPTYLPHRFVAKYLNMYCDNFDLRKYIKFNRSVTSITPEIDAQGHHTGRWEVVTQKCRRKQTPHGNSHSLPTRGLSPAGLRGQSPATPPLTPADIRQRNMSPARSVAAGMAELSVHDRRMRGMSPARGRSPMRTDGGAYDEASLMTTPPVNGYEYMPSSPKLSSSPADHNAFLEAGMAGSFLGSSSFPVIKSKAETFDFVIVATGHHWKPRLPDFAGMELFKGGVMHSHSYRVPYPFKDSRVLVVGVGNSGMDIAAELSHHARQVILSSRSGTWVLPRFTLFGLPTDHLSSRAASALPRSLVNFAIETLMRLQNGNLEKFGLKPDHSLMEANPTINGEVLERIGAGKILVRPNLTRFSSGTTVEFEDGTAEDVDTVVYCTGYKIEHPFLDSATILGQKPSSSNSPPASPVATIASTSSASSSATTSVANRVRLYKNVFPIHHKNIAFVGLVQPTGAIMPVSEMQSRWVSRVFAGISTLPTPAEMSLVVDKQITESPYTPRERHTIQVDYVTYMDEIAELVGCKPDLWKLWKSKWLLAAMVTFGPAVPAQYRLEGDGAWEGSEEVITEACKGYDFRKVVGYQAVTRLRDEPRADSSSN
ncbi:Cyclopentanone 1,2-monooxygenase (CPMO) [Blyttiomyces sp. JEL0837]|nr:Cyclopentanone 1,2-monooxygenase (CPMO) [Blyttiomyces sp. JEL0837]